MAGGIAIPMSGIGRRLSLGAGGTVKSLVYKQDSPGSMLEEGIRLPAGSDSIDERRRRARR